MADISAEAAKLRYEISEGYGKPKVLGDISIEPEFLSLGAFVVKRVAELYAAALNLEVPEAPNRVQGYNDIEMLVDGAAEIIKQGEPHLILARTREKTLELLAVNNGKLVAAAYGAEYDMWHVVHIVCHETAITYAAEAIKPGTGIRTSFTLRGYAQLAATVGHKISTGSLKADGQEFTYRITSEVSVERHSISSILDASFGTPLWDMYFDRFDF